jgi:hypothetical protein
MLRRTVATAATFHTLVLLLKSLVVVGLETKPPPLSNRRHTRFFSCWAHTTASAIKAVTTP